jgi:acyl-CoA synthetase (AMP-forming)/AMP-acid ligase II
MRPTLADPFGALTVVDLCRRQAAQLGATPLLDDGDRRLDHAGLWEEAGRAATCLAARGVGRGDRVVLSAPNSVDWVSTCIGVLMARGTVVPQENPQEGVETPRGTKLSPPNLSLTRTLKLT